MAGSTALPQMKSGPVESGPGGGHTGPGTAVGADASSHVASEEREEWLSILSHELRTPVAVALGNLRLLLSAGEEGLSPNQYQLTKTAEEYCARLDRFIADLIEVSYAGSLESSLDWKPGDLEAVIEKAHGMVAPILLQRGIDLVVDVPSHQGPAYFDEIRITHVFTNLLTNAIAVTDAGGLIRIECAPITRETESFLECRVIDQGPGVEHSERERIFEAFERGSSSTTVEGRGLGLALCRRIVEAHGGSLRVLEGAERGSIFSFTLPASPMPEESTGFMDSVADDTPSRHGKEID